jgi:LmbE family N-acetylglucosaminyl deacetylase
MVITAHPDDEAANFGGALCLYHARSAETCVLALTAGTAATHRGGTQSDEALGALRRTEFAASCETLGVSRGIVLDYPDGQLERQDVHRVVGDITRHVREFRPNVILTFGSDGFVTGHADHAMTSVFATLAFHWAGQGQRFPDQLGEVITPHRTQKLYYVTADFTLPGRPPIALAPATTVLDIAPYMETKIAAFSEHVSQAPLRQIFESTMRKYEPRELYHLTASVDIHIDARETDLFAGIIEHT